MDLSLIIPCYNEEKNISLLLDECEKVFKDENLKIEYIFINDGSKDNSFGEIKKLMDRKENIVGINFSRNFGKEAAIYAGLTKSKGRYVALIDADLQQHPSYVLKMYNYIIEHPEYDSVTCFQEKRKENFLLSFLKKMFYKIINMISEIEFYESASDFRLLNRNVVNSILEMKEYYRFSKGLFSWVGYNTYYMPYTVQKRQYGKSTWNLFSLFKYAFDGIIGFSIAPLKVATVSGIITFIISIIYFIVVVCQKVFGGIAIDGYATIVCLILLFGGLQMIFIGIIGEYLGRVYIETKRRPVYIIKEEIRNKK